MYTPYVHVQCMVCTKLLLTYVPQTRAGHPVQHMRPQQSPTPVQLIHTVMRSHDPYNNITYRVHDSVTMVTGKYLFVQDINT